MESQLLEDNLQSFKRWSFSKINQKLVVVLVCFILYLCFGATVFTAIEKPADQAIRSEIEELRGKFLQDHSDCLTDEDLEELLVRVIDADNKGVLPTLNVSDDPNWTFGQAFFFAGAVISTVGFGNISPVSQGGKAFTILYALLGIPLTLLTLSAMMERLKLPSLRLYELVQKRFAHLYKPLQLQLLHLGILLGAVVFFLFIIPAAIFTGIEDDDWSYLDAFYYCFTSLATISLGSQIPGEGEGQGNRDFYKFVMTAYLFVGLCCMMLILSTIYDIPQLNLRTVLGAKKTTDIREWHAGDVMQQAEPEIWRGNDTEYDNIGDEQNTNDRQDLLSVRNPSHPYYQ